MVVCKFWQSNSCKRGNQCNFEHPGSDRDRNQGLASNQNRFGALSTAGGHGGRGRSGAIGGGPSDPFGITIEGIKIDLNSRSGADPPGERPIWPLSAYAPGRDAPRQLMEGAIEQSPEEMRVKYYLAKALGNEQEYVNHERQMLEQAEQRVQTILNDPEGARKYVVDGQNDPSNRNALEVKPTQPFPRPQQKIGLGQSAGGFGSSSAPTAISGSTFGTATAFGASRPTFGSSSTPAQSGGFGASATSRAAPAFGATSQPGAGTGFGQTGGLGARPSPWGGGAQSTPAFGQTTAPTSTFGGVSAQPAAFGHTSAPATGLGAAAPSSRPAFGASGFGPQKPTGFGTSSPQPASSGFGAASASQPAFGSSGFGSSKPATAFGQSGFGAASQPAQSSPFGVQQPPTTSAFGTASGIGATKSPFGSAPQTAPAFGQTCTPATYPPFGSSTSATAFGTAGGFGAKTPAAFGSTANQERTAFGTASPFGGAPTTTSAFGAPSQGATAFGASSQTTNPANTAANHSQQQAYPSVWKGHQVQILQDTSDPRKPVTIPYYLVPDPTPQNPGNQKRVRIWFPHGKFDREIPDAEPLPETVESDLGKQLKELYDFMRMENAFKDGIMPEIPPKREWVGFDF